MRKAPNLFALDGLLKTIDGVRCQIVPGRWVPCRPLGFGGVPNRLRLAWLVFTGRADALTWPDGQ